MNHFETYQLCIVKTVRFKRSRVNGFAKLIFNFSILNETVHFCCEPHKKMKSLLKLTVLMLFTFQGLSQDVNIRKKEYLLENGSALSGYDPTAYFSGKARKGKKELSFLHEGINYQFATATNLENFKKNPAKYEPQYGGWCAYAMGSKGEKVEVDPETFKIVNGKLYLFYHTFFSNTLTDWNAYENTLKAKADLNWTKFIKK